MAVRYSILFLSAVPAGSLAASSAAFRQTVKQKRKQPRKRKHPRYTFSARHKETQTGPNVRSPWVTTPRVPPPPPPLSIPPPPPPPVPPLSHRCPSPPPLAAHLTPRRWSARSRVPRGCTSHPPKGPPLAISASPSSSPPWPLPTSWPAGPSITGCGWFAIEF